VLAADALDGFSAGAAIFRAVPAAPGRYSPITPAACGCEPTATADSLTGHG
jgi:hypothetical protein